jgi:quercetin dioxygenase-like cupin family protein
VEIKRNGSQASAQGPAEYFTGAVRIDQTFQGTDPACMSGAIVTFGAGWVQHEGGPVEEIRPGDVIWFPAGEKHWHGATASTTMSHIAIAEKLDGKAVDWMEKVTDQHYQP